MNNFLYVIKTNCTKNNFIFVKEYQILLKYLLYVFIDNTLQSSMCLHEGKINEAIQRSLTYDIACNSDYMQLIAYKLLFSINEYNVNEDALDTVTSLIDS